MMRRPTHLSMAAIVAIALSGGYLLTSQGIGGALTGEDLELDGGFNDVGLFVPHEPLEDDLNRLVIEVPRGDVVSQPLAATPGELDLSVLDPDLGVADLWVDETGNIWARYANAPDVRLTGTSSPNLDIDTLLVELRTDVNVAELRKIDSDTLALTTTYEAAELSELLSLEVLTDEPIVAFETDPYFGHQWGLENTAQESGYRDDADIDASGAWAASSLGEGVVVAILDSGVDFGHPDLAATRWSNRGETCGNGIDDDGNGYIDDCNGWDFVNNDSSPWDGNNHYHGTHVSGIVAARNNSIGIMGVAPRATIMDVRVLDTQGSGYTSAFAAAIRYAVDNGASVINMSLGTQPGAPRSGFASVEQSIEYARSRGVILVAAAGNSNVDIDVSAVWPASFALYYDNVIAIASTDYADGRSSFSNYGERTVTFGAPGSRILSSMPQSEWSYASGTSMAAPMVAGGLGLLLGDLPGSTPTDVINLMTDNLDRLDALSGLLVNPGRMNIANIYTDPAMPTVRLDATGLDNLTDTTPISAELHLTINDAAAFTDVTFTWRARLLTEVNGAAYGVLDHPVAVDGTVSASNGEALITLSAPTSVEADPTLTSTGAFIRIETSLPVGVYAVIVEAVSTNESTVVDGTTNVLFFTVQDPDSPTPTAASPTTTIATTPTTTTPTTGTDPSTPVTTTPTSTGSDPAAPTTTTSPTTVTATPTTTTSTTGTDPSTPVTTIAATPTTATPVTTTPNSTGSDPAAPTTTTSPTTVTATPTTTTTTSDPSTPVTTMAPARNGEWSIRLISPNVAPISTTGLVAIYGSFPSAPYVWFGDSPATPVLSASDYLLVQLPRVSTVGHVDVSLRTGGQTVLIAPGAFLFVDTTAETPPTTTQPTSATTSPTTATTIPGGTTTTQASTPTSEVTTTSARETTTTSPSGPEPVVDSTRFQFGSPMVLANGLTVGRVIQPSSPTGAVSVASWSTRACSTSICEATKL